MRIVKKISIPGYREHGQVSCYKCGGYGLEVSDHMDKPDGTKLYLGRCPECGFFTAYIIVPHAIVPGDTVLIMGKVVEPWVGSYTCLKDTAWEYLDKATVLKRTVGGGFLVGTDEHRLGVFAEEDLARLITVEEFLREPQSEVDGVRLIQDWEYEPPKTELPNSWWVRGIDWLWDKF